MYDDSLIVSASGVAFHMLLGAGTALLSLILFLGSMNTNAYQQPFQDHHQQDIVYAVATGTNSVFAIRGTQVLANTSVGAKPFGATFDETDHRVFVSNYANNSISVIDIRTDKVVDTFKGFNGPTGLIYVQYTWLLYVAEYQGNDVAVVNPFTGMILSRIAVGQGPENLAYNPINHNLYVANSNSETVSVIDSRSCKPIKNITVGPTPINLAFDQANGDIYVANENSGTVSVIGWDNNLVKTIELPSSPRSAPWAMAYDDSNHLMYVGDANFQGLVFLISRQNTIVGNLSLGGFSVLAGAAYDPSCHIVYFTDYQHGILDLVIGNNLVHTVNLGFDEELFGITVASY